MEDQQTTENNDDESTQGGHQGDGVCRDFCSQFRSQLFPDRLRNKQLSGVPMKARYSYRLAAHHEAGHALVTELLGGAVVSVALEPTPHCIPDVMGLCDEDIATICMGGAAGTLIKYGTMGPCELDVIAANVYTDDHLAALERAKSLIEGSRQRFDAKVCELLAELGPDRASEKAEVHVDTIMAVMKRGTTYANCELSELNQGEKK